MGGNVSPCFRRLGLGCLLKAGISTVTVTPESPGIELICSPVLGNHQMSSTARDNGVRQIERFEQWCGHLQCQSRYETNGAASSKFWCSHLSGGHPDTGRTNLQFTQQELHPIDPSPLTL